MQQFRTAIEQQAGGYEKTAQGFYQQCTRNAEKFEVFTQFVKGCQTNGREIVDESSETKMVARANQAPPSAASAIRRKLSDDPRNVQLLMGLAQTYSRNRDYSMSQAVLNRAAEVSPNTASVYSLQGMDYLFLNDMERASERFRKALKINGRDPTGLWGQAGLYSAFGHKGRLSSAVGKARSAGQPLDPVHPFISSVR